MTLISSEVADTISNMIDLSVGTSEQANVVLMAAMISIVIWAVAAWYFGIPTSESHALIAGLTGAALAFGGIGAINMQEWRKVIIGLVVSSVLGFGGGFFIARLIELAFRNVNRLILEPFFGGGQVFGAASMAFLHGAQDGQKFMGVFMLALYLNGMAERGSDGTFVIPLGVMVICSLTMGIGTMVGGGRIIKSVGMNMVKMRRYQGFASDIAAGACLLLASLTGIPVSTTHTKTTAIMGVGASRRLSSVNWNLVKDMVLAWVLTFPGCGFIGYTMAKLFLYIFL